MRIAGKTKLFPAVMLKALKKEGAGQTGFGGLCQPRGIHFDDLSAARRRQGDFIFQILDLRFGIL